MRTSITWSEVSGRRLARQHLAQPAAGLGPARISADMLGAHAQVMSAAEVSIALRSTALTSADVRAALWEQRTLVKTRGPRGTVHLIAAADLPLWTGVLSSVPAVAGPRAEGRMTPAQTDEVVAALADAVTDAELTVDELTDAVVARVGAWAGDRVMEAFQDKWPRWRQVEAVAVHRGAMCFGPVRGRRTTYTSPRRWLPGFAPEPADEAVPALVRRFLHVYGPATPAQFARWLGAPPGWASAVFARQPGTEEVELDGTVALVNSGDVGGGSCSAGAGVRLLPYFDAYLIGCHPRERLFPGRAAERALTGGQAGNVPVLLIDGRVAGVWHQRRSGRRITITVEPLDPLSGAHRQMLDDQVCRIGEILQGTATLTLGAVHAGAHA